MTSSRFVGCGTPELNPILVASGRKVLNLRESLPENHVQ
jgi:hypothetical protein